MRSWGRDIKKILVGTPLGGGGDAALLAAAALARAQDAELVVLSVEPPLDAREVFDPDGVPVAANHLPRLRREFPAVRIRARSVRGDAVRRMCEVASTEQPDLIVVPHGRAGGHALLTRRASRSLAERAPCPVLLVAS